MLSTTLKRSVATLGVVAGLLAAAVPAGAAPNVALPPPAKGEHTIVDRAACNTSLGREGSIECLVRAR